MTKGIIACASYQFHFQVSQDVMVSGDEPWHLGCHPSSPLRMTAIVWFKVELASWVQEECGISF